MDYFYIENITVIEFGENVFTYTCGNYTLQCNVMYVYWPGIYTYPKLWPFIMYIYIYIRICVYILYYMHNIIILSNFIKLSLLLAYVCVTFAFIIIIYYQMRVKYIVKQLMNMYCAISIYI